MTGDRVVSDLMLPLWEEVLWPLLDAWDRRALLLLPPFGERADGPQGADSAGAQHPAAWRASLPF